jgi:hypothetical protein
MSSGGAQVLSMLQLQESRQNVKRLFQTWSMVNDDNMQQMLTAWTQAKAGDRVNPL